MLMVIKKSLTHATASSYVCYLNYSATLITLMKVYWPTSPQYNDRNNFIAWRGGIF